MKENYNIKISCILPVYNGADRVSKSIESILNQTFKDFELIIVNDGSTDNTPKIIDEYAQKDSRIKVIHQENKTLPGALNTGFAAAQGDYHTWTSDDNLYKPQAFEKLLEKMQENPNVDIGYGTYDVFNEISKKSYVHELLDPKHYIDNCVYGAYFLYKKEVTKKIQYDLKAFGAEDYHFCLKAHYEGFNFKGWSINYYIYVIHDKALSITSKKRIFNAFYYSVLDVILHYNLSYSEILDLLIKVFTLRSFSLDRLNCINMKSVIKKYNISIISLYWVLIKNIHRKRYKLNALLRIYKNLKQLKIKSI